MEQNGTLVKTMYQLAEYVPSARKIDELSRRIFSLRIAKLKSQRADQVLEWRPQNERQRVDRSSTRPFGLKPLCVEFYMEVLCPAVLLKAVDDYDDNK